MKSPQTELHRHLDVSTRLETLLELAQERGLESQGTSPQVFRDKVIISKPMTDLSTVLAQFGIFQKVLDRPEVLERVAFEAVEDIYREGTRKVELRFSPTFVCESKSLSWQDALESFERGIKRALTSRPDMQAGLLCIASRDYGIDAAEETADFFLKNRTRFVGFDLAGNETDWPCRLFENAFKKLRAASAKITVHAGEASGPENMWEAIDLLGAQRIGHGIRCVEDPKLVEELQRREICLEMCPTSNWLTQCVTDLGNHPLPRVLRAGVRVCLNTDDPGIFAVTLPGEAKICREKMGMSQAEVEKCYDNAHLSSFISTV